VALPLAELKEGRGFSITTAAMALAAVVRSRALTGLSVHVPAVEVLAAVVHLAGSLVVIRPAVFLVDTHLVVSRVAIHSAAFRVVFTVAEAVDKSQAKLIQKEEQSILFFCLLTPIIKKDALPSRASNYLKTCRFYFSDKRLDTFSPEQYTLMIDRESGLGFGLWLGRSESLELIFCCIIPRPHPRQG
jgi:hypothetical protein